MVLWPVSDFRRIWIPAVLLLTIGSVASLILATVILDSLMQRVSGGGSMTTMLPGAVYASVTVVKVCLVLGGLSAIVVTPASRFRSRSV
jgi:hypothetical protein